MALAPDSVLAKTPKGRDEIETRQHKLEQKLRMLLITVNGKLTAAELAAQFAKSGDVMPLLEQLLRDGFIQQAIDPAAQLARARTGISAALTDALGPEAESIAIKIEAAKSLEELRGYLDSRRSALDTMLGKARAPIFWKKVDPLL